MKIYKNFLPKELFETLKDNMMGDHFPWYFNNFINYEHENKSNSQFTFTFIKSNNWECWGTWKEIMIPVLKQIKYNQIRRVKANLVTKTNEIVEHGYHTDYDTGTTGILYMNNCNGYTKFKNGEKVLSEENKYVEFSSNLEHTGSSCTDEKRRVVINFNYQWTSQTKKETQSQSSLDILKEKW